MKNHSTSVYMTAERLLLCAAAGVLAPLYGQLQQSGGPGSTVTANQGGTWNVNNITGTVVLPTGAATAAKQPALGTAGSPPAWQAVPTSNTTITATISCVLAIIISSTNASAQTVTITDGQGTPVTIANAFSVPANSQVTFPLHGSQMTNGIKWSAGGTGLTGTVVAYQ